MDLNAPLGTDPPRRSRLLSDGRTLGLIAGSGIVLASLAGLGLLLAFADPHGGDPYVVATIPPAGPSVPAAETVPASRSTIRPGASPSTQTAIDPSQTGSLPRKGGASDASPDTGTMENGVKVFRSARLSPAADGGATHGGPLVIDVSKVLDAPPGHSRLPSGDATGAQPTSTRGRPRVAIFVSGMGLSQAATRAALDAMPAAVTLAFVPYGATIAATVAAAKAKGHEILLQIPMRNVTGSPGPHALRPDEPASALREDLAWLTSRFEGYDGMTNLLGAPVTADATVMTALMRAAGTRGLFYVDDGLSPRETGLAVAAGLDVPTLRADLVLDATADPRAIEANLRTLAATARRKGYAIGMASGLPDHMAEIAHFAGGLEAQGIALVPLSDLIAESATKRPGVAVAR